MMVSLEEPTVDPVIKKKKIKKRKLEQESETTVKETVLDENLNPDEKIKKKKKKNKENKEVEEDVKQVEEEPVKKKKKKSKDKAAEESDTKDKDSDDAGDVEESGPFKKCFYTVSSVTEAVSKVEVKEYYSKHNITLYGKGKKKFKPVRTFPELGFSDSIMKICSDFTAPTPIQAQCWPILASGRDIIGIAETGSGKTLAFSIPGTLINNLFIQGVS